MATVLVIAIIINIMLIVYRIYNIRLSRDWNDDAFLFFLSMKNSIMNAGYTDPELRNFYYKMYEKMAGERGMLVDIADTGKRTKVVFLSPMLVVEQFV